MHLSLDLSKYSETVPPRHDGRDGKRREILKPTVVTLPADDNPYLYRYLCPYQEMNLQFAIHLINFYNPTEMADSLQLHPISPVAFPLYLYFPLRTSCSISRYDGG